MNIRNVLSLAVLLGLSHSQSVLQLAEKGRAFEAAQHADDTLSWYTPPSNFSSSLEPGTLLELEDATNLLNYTVPSGLTMSRIKYTTLDINGTVLPTSGYVLWPYTPPTKEGYPMVAWAHGTSGVFAPCAPSNYRALQYHFMVPFALALQGIAVVAPDYAGLGINTLPSGEQFHHPWVTAPAQAHDLTYAIVAARKAFPELLPEQGPFVAAGHSQGGRASWYFAQQQEKRTLPGYKGTVSIAPPVDFLGPLQNALANASLPYALSVLSFQPLLNDAITTVFPAFNYGGLTSKSLKTWQNGVAAVKGCLPTEFLSFSKLLPSQLGRPDFVSNPYFQEWSKLTNPGNATFKGPLLVILGEADTVVDFDSSAATAHETCRLNKQQHWGQHLELHTYSGVGHLPVIQASQQTWMLWVKERLRGGDAEKGGCVFERVEGFRTADSTPGSAPNWLVEWADPLTDFWEFLL